ncbi:MAG: hypothetical protein HBSIN02_12120 [Bacteroidia bacterium]|nr:MAG: hypothetical protein HBSIN02_12120 [Bacteroidia bacterium]
MTTQSATSSQSDRGRGALILVLGILSLVMFGLLTGIPAWVMGHTDLRRMREGTMDRTDEGITRAGMILGIIGTVLSGLAILVILLVILGVLSLAGVILFEAEAIKAQERSIEAHLHTIATEARAWRTEHGSYEGFEIPSELSKTSREVYSAQVRTEQIRLRARATNRRGAIEATLNRDGDLVDWSYSGVFAEHDSDVFEHIIHPFTHHGLYDQHPLDRPFAVFCPV